MSMAHATWQEVTMHHRTPYIFGHFYKINGRSQNVHILQIWVTWASKITLKNLRLCSIKLREATPPVTSHITWSRSIKCFILLSFGGFSFKYKSRKIKMNTEIGHICTQSGTWASGYSWLIASSKPQSYSLPTLWSCLCLLV